MSDRGPFIQPAPWHANLLGWRYSEWFWRNSFRLGRQIPRDRRWCCIHLGFVTVAFDALEWWEEVYRA